jgi:RimJ/RimL family protein N-acetyltransferase
MSLKFPEFPILVTDRLSLRKITKSDGPIIFFLRTDKEVNKYIHRPKPHKNVKEAEEFIDKITLGMENGKSINWGITLHGEDDLIGSICLWNFSADNKTGEVGYDLNPAYQNQGIMTEALQCVLNFGFNTIDLRKIEAYTHRNNESSKRLLIKNDFELIENRTDQDNSDNIIYEINNPALNKG